MMQPADTPPQPESDKKRGERRLRNSTRSKGCSDDAPGTRVPQEISEVPFDIALSLLRPDEVEKLRRYILSSLDKYPS
ncbi:hypothetical protein KSF_049030 [Reticulibacter mediterranei]|uniref:Uncharacterized protein n=1 Tax=Reticulibacter mediterranei TaxID=2778369 RepID=A0A8J3N426_9CHLR|nr:hypothetical protein KSF_049030 [Reticulibacter mediterranei]